MIEKPKKPKQPLADNKPKRLEGQGAMRLQGIFVYSVRKGFLTAQGKTKKVENKPKWLYKYERY